MHSFARHFHGSSGEESAKETKGLILNGAGATTFMDGSGTPSCSVARVGN